MIAIAPMIDVKFVLIQLKRIWKKFQRLSSPQLLNAKPRSLLLHIKGFEDSPQSETLVAAARERVEEAGAAADKMSRFEQHLMKMVYSIVFRIEKNYFKKWISSL